MSGGDVGFALEPRYLVLDLEFLALDGGDFCVRRGWVRDGICQVGFQRAVLCKQFCKGL